MFLRNYDEIQDIIKKNDIYKRDLFLENQSNAIDIVLGNSNIEILNSVKYKILTRNIKI